MAADPNEQHMKNLFSSEDKLVVKSAHKLGKAKNYSPAIVLALIERLKRTSSSIYSSTHCSCSYNALNEIAIALVKCDSVQGFEQLIKSYYEFTGVIGGQESGNILLNALYKYPSPKAIDILIKYADKESYQKSRNIFYALKCVVEKCISDIPSGDLDRLAELKDFSVTNYAKIAVSSDYGDEYEVIHMDCSGIRDAAKKELSRRGEN